MSTKEIEKLVKILTKASQEYYLTDKSSLTDDEFDELKDRLENLDPDNEFFKTVGTKQAFKGYWSKKEHVIIMGSLLKVNTFDELESWSKKYTNGFFCWQEKLDGLSLELIYTNGFLSDAITRGDGLIGESILINIKKIKNIKSFIKEFEKIETVSVRGEIVLLKEKWIKHFNGEKNARNLASGVLRRKDGVGCEFLDFYAYDIVGVKKDTEEDKLNFLNVFFDVPSYGTGNLLLVEEVYSNYIKKLRDKCSYDIDGLVVKENSIVKQEKEGMINNRPKAQRAYKFPALAKSTILENFIYQVGRTGVITPVAEFEPVQLMGAEVKRASLANFAEIRRLNLNIKDKILVKRANDVIPKVVEVLEKNNKKSVDLITNCPCCNSILVKDGIADDGLFIRLLCQNNLCEEQVIGSLDHFLDVLGVKTFGYKIIQKLVKEKLINKIEDFFTISVDKLTDIEKLGAKSALNFKSSLKDNITNIKETKFLNAVGFHSFVVETLEENGYTFKDFDKLNLDKLKEMHGIGEEKAQEFLLFYQKEKLQIEKLIKYFSFKEKNSESKLFGQSFCFTGFRDKNLEKIIENLGGTISNSVNKKLSFLICADKDENSSKIEKAKKENIKILSKKELENLLK